ncbi:alpha/beta hydrolase [Streptomyces europaeiscabiei]|uniref:alpha/beta fold hydrolase n=1 Tax=Streptomyces europaeiscabiei TaxID=146819 RepID=UPI0029BC7299|nr:alpha/beta hydrolase [Streptomyces europaeiscabiei]MDX3696581.1 alpha/beta hydrolase [Streptomyces europaeiscabiei]
MTAHLAFVLIHGAWHDGSLWEPVASHLRTEGHVVHTPTVAGFGSGASTDVSHADGVTSIVRYIEQHDLTHIVLLGHSFGGTIVSKVAEAMPERIRRLVYWNAFVLEDGHSINDESPVVYRELMLATAIDGTFSLPWTLWRERFLNDADESTARAAFEKLCPTPLAMLEDKVDLNADCGGDPALFVSQLLGRHRHAAGRVRMVTALPRTPRPLSPRSDARESRGAFHATRRPGGQVRRSRA